MQLPLAKKELEVLGRGVRGEDPFSKGSPPDKSHRQYGKLLFAAIHIEIGVLFLQIFFEKIIFSCNHLRILRVYITETHRTVQTSKGGKRK